jgi:hypothetical protein
MALRWWMIAATMTKTSMLGGFRSTSIGLQRDAATWPVIKVHHVKFVLSGVRLAACIQPQMMIITLDLRTANRPNSSDPIVRQHLMLTAQGTRRRGRGGGGAGPGCRLVNLMLLELSLLTGLGAVRRFTSSNWLAHIISHNIITYACQVNNTNL